MLKIILGSKVLALGSDTARMSFRHKASMGTPKDVMRYSERCLTWFWVQFLTCLGYEIEICQKLSAGLQSSVWPIHGQMFCKFLWMVQCVEKCPEGPRGSPHTPVSVCDYIKVNLFSKP